MFELLTPHPRETVLFAQLSLKDVPLAWNLAHRLGLPDNAIWSDLANAYERLDPIAVVPVYARLVEYRLADADARRYRGAAPGCNKSLTGPACLDGETSSN